MFRCPDCYCAYSGARGGAPTKKGSTCQVAWSLPEGGLCDRADGCCSSVSVRGHFCPTTDPKIGINNYGDGAFQFDRCTPTDEDEDEDEDEEAVTATTTTTATTASPSHKGGAMA